MVIGILKWIFKHFAPYVAGILVGVGFFFLLLYLLPMLPDVPVLDWPMGPANKEVALPAPIRTTQTEAPAPATVSPSVVGAKPVAPVTPPDTRQASQVVKTAGPDRRVEEESLSAAMATEQPIETELDSDPVEVPIAPPPSKPAAQKKTSAQEAKSDCGTPPMRPGRSMDQYLACQWRADCLNRLGRARSMIEQDKRRCPQGGAEAQSCLAYYRALEMQYHPSLCGGWSAAPMPGQW